MLNRVEKLREQLRILGLDAIVITHPSNRRYLSGYAAEDHPPNESAGHLVVGENKSFLVTSRMESERANQQAPGFEIYNQTYPFAQADVDLLKAIGARRIGFEDESILYRDHSILRSSLDDSVELVPVGNMVDRLRMVKAADEIDTISRAIAITDQAFEAVTAENAAGITERELADHIDRTMRELGADGNAFPTIVASGHNAALPHHQPTDRPIGEGEPVIIDMGALLDGYCADLTRTIWIGMPNDILGTIYPVVLEALDTAKRAIKPGMSGREADAIARAVINAAGFGDSFIHSLGHGVGVRVHEGPSLSTRSNDTLAPGNVVTLEPGIYIPGQGGVRIEDVVLIEEDGIRILTNAPKQNID